MAGFDLTDRIILVVGASAGIGRSTADLLLAKGARVIVAGRRLETLQTVAAGRNGRCLPLVVDVADAASAASILDRLPEAWRDVHGVVVCAGHDIGGRVRFDEGSAEDWASIIETNVTGTIRVCRAVIEMMAARGTGHIVTLGSISGLKTYAGGTIYAASKFAVRAFTDALRLDFKDTDLRITEILPGLVRTEFATRRHRGDSDRAGAFYDAAPATLNPEDVAAAIVWAMEQPESVNIGQILVQPTRNKG